MSKKEFPSTVPDQEYELKSIQFPLGPIDIFNKGKMHSLSTSQGLVMEEDGNGYVVVRMAEGASTSYFVIPTSLCVLKYDLKKQ